MKPPSREAVGTGLLLLAAVAVLAFSVVVFQHDPRPPASRSRLVPRPDVEVVPTREPAEHPSASPSVPVAAKSSVSMLVIGDSIARGAYSSEPAGTFPHLLRDMFRDADHPTRLAILGRPGDSTATTADRLEAMTVPMANIVVIELGTADLASDDPVDPAAFTEAYARVLASLSTASDTHLACVGVWSQASDRAAADRAIRTACESRGGVFVPLTRIAAVPDHRTVVGTPFRGGATTTAPLPNDAGHRAIADAVLAGLRQAQRG